MIEEQCYKADKPVHTRTQQVGSSIFQFMLRRCLDFVSHLPNEINDTPATDTTALSQRHQAARVFRGLQ